MDVYFLQIKKVYIFLPWIFKQNSEGKKIAIKKKNCDFLTYNCKTILHIKHTMLNNYTTIARFSFFCCFLNYIHFYIYFLFSKAPLIWTWQ